MALIDSGSWEPGARSPLVRIFDVWGLFWCPFIYTLILWHQAKLEMSSSHRMALKFLPNESVRLSMLPPKPTLLAMAYEYLCSLLYYFNLNWKDNNKLFVCLTQSEFFWPVSGRVAGWGWLFEHFFESSI